MPFCWPAMPACLARRRAGTKLSSGPPPRCATTPRCATPLDTSSTPYRCGARLEQAADELKAVVQAERLLRAGRELTEEEKRLAVMAERCRLVNMRERAQLIVDSFLDGAG